jgi:hypothetical protein
MGQASSSVHPKNPAVDSRIGVGFYHENKELILIG